MRSCPFCQTWKATRWAWRCRRGVQPRVIAVAVVVAGVGLGGVQVVGIHLAVAGLAHQQPGHLGQVGVQQLFQLVVGFAVGHPGGQQPQQGHRAGDAEDQPALQRDGTARAHASRGSM
jgi:hypothetical protein